MGGVRAGILYTVRLTKAVAAATSVAVHMEYVNDVQLCEPKSVTVSCYEHTSLVPVGVD